MNLHRPNRDSIGDLVRPGVASDEALSSLGSTTEVRKYDLRQVVLFPTQESASASGKKSNRKGLPTPGASTRSTPCLVAPPIYEVDPPYPPGLSSHGQTDPYGDDDIAPLHPPGLAQDWSPPVQYNRQESVTVHIPVPNPHTPYQHTNDSSYDLDLPTLKYSWGPPPPKPLSQRVVSALFGWLDHLQQYEPRPYSFSTRSSTQKPSERRPAPPGRSNSTPNADGRQRRPHLRWRRT